MKKILCTALLTSSLLFTAPLHGEEYQHHLQKKGIHISWSLKNESIAIKLEAPTKGWLAVGFNPSHKMKDANIIIGYVKDGKVSLRDDFGTSKGGHRADSSLGGSNNLTNINGFEKDGRTTLSFTLPLSSKEHGDNTIVKGENKILLAYGKNDSFTSYHNKIAKMRVNLITGSKNGW